MLHDLMRHKSSQWSRHMAAQSWDSIPLWEENISIPELVTLLMMSHDEC